MGAVYRGMVVAVVLAMGGGVAQAQTPPSYDTPDLPDLPKPDQIVKYKVTIKGTQIAGLTFRFDASSANCKNEQHGFIRDNWEYARGKSVTMVFRRYGKTVLLNRQGRKPGDAAFAVTGDLVRIAEGSRENCQTGTSLLFQDPTCNKHFNVARNLRFSYVTSGEDPRLYVEGSGALPKNPTEPCTKDVDVLSPEYPTFMRASQIIGPKRLFARKKGFKLKFTAPKAIMPFAPPYTEITSFEASNVFELTLTRVK